MAQFSATVKVVDLDDFITPSQACIKPVEIPRVTQKTATICIEEDGAAIETTSSGSSKRLAKASITLADCLACSGCVTSAEAILVTEQSLDQVSRIIRDHAEAGNPRHLVVTVSPQSVASYAAAHDLTLEKADGAIRAFFCEKGFDAVLNSTMARSIALEAMYSEFRARLAAGTALPLLTSACPGWICYAEKSHGEHALPYISRVRSPQAIMGAFVKDFLARLNGWSATNVFHLTVMPCFDKKLEASRPDFLLPGTELREVDCVISSFELDQLMSLPPTDPGAGCDSLSSNRPSTSLLDADHRPSGQGHGSPSDQRSRDPNHEMDTHALPTPTDPKSRTRLNHDASLLNDRLSLAAQTDRVSSPKEGATEHALPKQPWLTYPLVTHPGGGSGGYADYMARRLLQEDCGEFGEPEFIVGRNQDFHECTLSLPSVSSEPISVVKAYGFRNIQTVIQKIKRRKAKHHFVEIMACPQGCLNGGGQIRPSEMSDNKSRLAKVTSLYDSASAITPAADAIAKSVVESWLGTLDSEEGRKMLFTEYHHVPKSDFLLGPMTKW